MKKLLCLFTGALLVLSVFAQEAETSIQETETPEAKVRISDSKDLSPAEAAISSLGENAFIIDIEADNLKFRDYMKLYYHGYNATEFSVYWYNSEVSKWWLISKVPFKKTAQVGTIYTSAKTVKNAKLYALVPSNNTEFKYSCEIKNHDLRITITSEMPEIEENDDVLEPVAPVTAVTPAPAAAPVLPEILDDDDLDTNTTKTRRRRNPKVDANTLPSIPYKDAEVISIKNLDARDFVCFVNKSSYEGISFDLYVMTKYNSRWHLFSTAYLHNYNDRDTIHSPIDIEDVEYIAIRPRRSRDYNYKIYEKHHDLYIEVQDFDEDGVLNF